MNILLILMILPMLYLIYDLIEEIKRNKCLMIIFQLPFLYVDYKTTLRLDILVVMIEIDDYTGACLAPSFIKETVEDPSVLKTIRKSDNTLEFFVMLPYIIFAAILSYYKENDIIAFYKENNFVENMHKYGEDKSLENWNLYNFLFEFLKNGHPKEYKVVKDFISLNEELIKENKKENQVICKTISRLLYTGYNYIDDNKYQKFITGRKSIT